MKRRRLYADEAVGTGEINVSPLIDIVFILLIFFIVTTVFVEDTGVEVRRPQAVSAAALERNAILIAITADGRVMYGGREIGARGVRAIVERRGRKEELPVIIQADAAVPVELYVKVHDEAALGGATAINLATVAVAGR
tara:strand:+ start:125 stop:541 length:417 start_codon:yes stop_codon:yes gene_type:complete